MSLDVFNRVKSAAELEEEMLAKMPKFKARPLPKKVIAFSKVKGFATTVFRNSHWSQLVRSYCLYVICSVIVLHSTRRNYGVQQKVYRVSKF